MESIIRAMQRNKLGICDLHCHVLPGMDDGCRSVEESIRVMEESARQGVGAMMATPHYYPRETVESFLSRRHAAYSQLNEIIKGKKKNLPVLNLGAEVAWHNGLIYEERLRNCALESPTICCWRCHLQNGHRVCWLMSESWAVCAISG